MIGAITAAMRRAPGWDPRRVATRTSVAAARLASLTRTSAPGCILVTGGSGLVGRALQRAVAASEAQGHGHATWIFMSSADGDLTDPRVVEDIFATTRPHTVIHLAAAVGGLFKNMYQRADMYERNIRMNTNILESARRAGVPRVLCMLSTCVFPDGLDHLTAEDLHRGPPHPSNEGYAYAKRMMEVHARIVSTTSGTRVTCLTPTNVYGPDDNFDLEDAHVVPALIHRGYLARAAGQPFIVRGTGRPLRQFIHSDDLARMILAVLEMPDPPAHILCTPPAADQVTIGDVARAIAQALGYEHALAFDPTYADGQYKKTAEPSPLWANFAFTPLAEGIASTVAWFEKAVPSDRPPRGVGV